MGYPIRKSPDQQLIASPRSLSQLTTSFIDFTYQGIHHMPLVTWLTPYEPYLFSQIDNIFTFINISTISKNKKFIVWSWQGSNLRPSRCKRDALPTELQPRKKTKFCSFNLKWVWVDSNYRPPPYQSGALTNWATNPKNIRELCENKNQYKVRPSSLTS